MVRCVYLLYIYIYVFPVLAQADPACNDTMTRMLGGGGTPPRQLLPSQELLMISPLVRIELPTPLLAPALVGALKRYLYDGLHFTSEGYLEFARLVATELTRLLPWPPARVDG